MSITPELLARINQLARKKRTTGLNDEELAEQKKLYKIYLAAIRGQVTNLLDSIELVDAPPPDKKLQPGGQLLHQTTIALEQVVH